MPYTKRSWRVAAALFALALGLPSAATAESLVRLIATLGSPSPASYQKFGLSVAAGDGLVLVGEPRAGAGGLGAAGLAYLFRPDGSLVAAIQAPTPAKDGRLGGFYMANKALALGSGLILVAEDLANSAGSIHLFDGAGGHRATLACPDRARKERSFGFASAIDGDRILTSSYCGGAYLYGLDGSLLVNLPSPDGIRTWGFGQALALRGDTLVVTDFSATVDGKDGAGRALIFDRSGKLRAELPSPAPEPAPKTWIHPGIFGESAATNGTLVAIGAARASEPDGRRLGRIYLYAADGSPRGILPAPEGALHFGCSLAMSDSLLAVGADQTTVGDKKVAGRVYLFDLGGRPLGSIEAPTPCGGGGFGWSLALDGELLVVSEPSAKVGEAEGAGLVHVFEIGAGLVAAAP